MLDRGVEVLSGGATEKLQNRQPSSTAKFLGGPSLEQDRRCTDQLPNTNFRLRDGAVEAADATRMKPKKQEPRRELHRRVEELARTQVCGSSPPLKKSIEVEAR